MLVKSGKALPLQMYHVGMMSGWFAASAALATSANVLGPPVRDTEDDGIRQVAAEDVARLLERDLPGLGGGEVLLEAQGLREHRRALRGLGGHPAAQEPDDGARDDEPDAERDSPGEAAPEDGRERRGRRRA